MREATGELNLTLIVVLAVAAMVAFFSMVLWPIIKNSIHETNDCSNAICTCKTLNCSEEKNSGVIYCEDEIVCPYKG